MMSDIQRLVRRTFSYANTAKAIGKTVKTGDPGYVINRAGRLTTYSLARRLANRLFPPKRRAR
jgi:hypothetical protein